MKSLLIIILLIGFLPAYKNIGYEMTNSAKILKNYSNNVSIDYEINISVDSNYIDFPKFITVRIKNSGEQVKLNNFVISFYYDNNGFNCLSKDFRFLNNDLVLHKGQTLKKVLYLDSLDYKDFKSDINVDFNYVKKQLKGSNKWTIRASLNDKRLFENPLISSDLVYSNFLEMKNK